MQLPGRLLRLHWDQSCEYMTPDRRQRTSTYLIARQDLLDPWYAPTPPLTGVDSVAPSPGDAPWPAFSQSPTETATGTQDVSASHAIARVMLTWTR
ncbi:hypothetical protein BC827DRAFT_1201490 [Russula dissimulans]|nr:hypothetical protein BC827DRAFT_1201490 [Russula dissimulans]